MNHKFTFAEKYLAVHGVDMTGWSCRHICIQVACLNTSHLHCTSPTQNFTVLALLISCISPSHTYFMHKWIQLWPDATYIHRVISRLGWILKQLSMTLIQIIMLSLQNAMPTVHTYLYISHQLWFKKTWFLNAMIMLCWLHWTEHTWVNIHDSLHSCYVYVTGNKYMSYLHIHFMAK